MRKVEKLAAVIVLILLAFVYGHVHKTHAIYDRMIENDQYVMMDVSQDQISQEFVCEEETLDGIQAVSYTHLFRWHLLFRSVSIS